MYDYDRFRQWLRDAAGVAADAPLVAVGTMGKHGERRERPITQRDQFADLLGYVLTGAAPPEFDPVRGRWVLIFAPGDPPRPG